jgi:hypothetical protein
VPHLDPSGHFYTVLKKGQTYEFYWNRHGSRERFCTLQLKPDAQSRQKITVDYRPSQSGAIAAMPKTVWRENSSLMHEYDLAGFPANPNTPETQKIADAIRSARTTGERASAHEMLAHYYRYTKLDSARAEAEFRKADKLKEAVKD